MHHPLLLYSTNSWLAHSFAERYYDSVHYAWCRSHFSAHDARLSVAMSPTATPKDMYGRLCTDVARCDHHSPWIERNRIGILRDASCKLQAGIITRDQEGQIVSILEAREVLDFRPLLFIIPYVKAVGLAVEVPPGKQAHSLSREFQVEALPMDCFDGIELRELSGV